MPGCLPPQETYLRADYFHVTKRFGIVGASQLPLHYMLSMKSRASPIAWLWQTSHERLNPWHRMLGRIIVMLLSCHAICYLNYFMQTGTLLSRLQGRTEAVGLTSILMLSLLVLSSLTNVRKWSYRVFFVLHLTIGSSILPLLFVHVSHLRIYVLEALALFVIDLLARKLGTVTGYAKISRIASTNLIKLEVDLPETASAQFQGAFGRHVYLSIPPPSRPARTGTLSMYELLFNPFTIADVTEARITLVMRVLQGPVTKALDLLTSLSKAKPPLCVEGPYGHPIDLQSLAADCATMLFVAGGIGATYVLPLYEASKQQLALHGRSLDIAQLVWTMKSEREATWAMQRGAKEQLSDDPNAQLFITGTTGSQSMESSEPEPQDESVEMTELAGLNPSDPKTRQGRPQLGEGVQGVFSRHASGKVAIIVCGPAGLARDLRRHVGSWVEQGRDVYWHSEGFGW